MECLIVVVLLNLGGIKRLKRKRVGEEQKCGIGTGGSAVAAKDWEKEKKVNEFFY